MPLNDLGEIIGKLERIDVQEKLGIVTLEFTFTEKVDIPIDACDRDVLVSSLGKKICILRIDGSYKVKECSGKDDGIPLVYRKRDAVDYKTICDEIDSL